MYVEFLLDVDREAVLLRLLALLPSVTRTPLEFDTFQSIFAHAVTACVRACAADACDATLRLLTWTTSEVTALSVDVLTADEVCCGRLRTAVCLSVGPIEKYLMFCVTLACARRPGAAARVERRRRER